VAGPIGPPVKGSEVLGSEVLEIVEKQIDDLHRDLDVQMKRIAQIQQQMDELRETVRRVLSSTNPSS
jgi:prefoldin subunit 5